MKSTYTLTVPQSLYDAVCEECSQGFADSYLYGAVLRGSALHPRTLTAALALEQDSRFRALAKSLNINVHRPTPYPGDGDRLTAKQAREQMIYD